jgi:2-polyprenyl-3-methyl-5-hydroxy-6-metoxy-1,4-benzoquinol methylase
MDQMVENARPEEKEIYKQMWSKPQYRVVAPGEHAAHEFLKQAQPKPGASVLDLGCGTGRGGLALAVFGSMNVTMVDFADNCLDEDIRPILKTQSHAIRFVEADLTKKLPVQAEYGFCTDVLEHIPEKDVDAVIDNCLLSCQHMFFQICTVEDHCGALIGHSLHLTVKPFAWWLQKFNERQCVIHWSKDCGENVMFYVSAWQTGEIFAESGIINTQIEEVRANVKHNIAQGYKQAEPHETNNREVIILGGGPSMNRHIEEIRQKREEGAALVCLNGAYNWALNNGLTPSAMIMVDARGFNERFTQRSIPNCIYMLASQCSPKALENVPKEQVLLWHTTAEMIRDELNAQYEVWWGIPGGSTVLLRALPLLRLLGFKSFHLYGCDSCLDEDKFHHAFSQPENDKDITLPVNVDGRIFYCHPWMVSQAQEFMDIIRFMGEEMELEVHGDGLLSWILETGARELDKQEAVTQ